MPDSSVLPVQPGPVKAVRLLLSFEGEGVNLLSQQSVEMTLPPSEQDGGAEGQRGFWYELRDEQNRPLYRRVMHNPMREDVEVFSDDPKQSVSRQIVPNRKGVFAVLVPDVEAGHTVALVGSPLRVDVANQPAREIARFTLRKQ
jgi:hypothetical protein